MPAHDPDDGLQSGCEPPSYARLIDRVPAEASRPFAGFADHEECRRICRSLGKSDPFVMRTFPKAARRSVNALRAFTGVPSQWVESSSGKSTVEVRSRLREWRAELLRGLEGVRPEHPVLRAFCDAAHDCAIPLEEPLCYLNALEDALDVARYATFGDLRAHMRGSASAVSLMICHILDIPLTQRSTKAAVALGEATELTSYLQNLGEDARRGQIYLPLEDLETFEVRETELTLGIISDRMIRLIRFETDRARALYAEADRGIANLPTSCKRPFRVVRALSSKVLDKIEAHDFDVFGPPLRVGRLEHLLTTASLWFKS